MDDEYQTEPVFTLLAVQTKTKADSKAPIYATIKLLSEIVRWPGQYNIVGRYRGSDIQGGYSAGCNGDESYAFDVMMKALKYSRSVGQP